MCASPLRQSSQPERSPPPKKQITNGISPQRNTQEHYFISSLQIQLNQLNTKYNDLIKIHNLLENNQKAVSFDGNQLNFNKYSCKRGICGLKRIFVSLKINQMQEKKKLEACKPTLPSNLR